MGSAQVRYFASFSGYDLPIKPVEEITKEDTAKRRAYCVANYDASGRITAIEKVLDGKRFFLHEYSYNPKGALTEARVTNQEGKTTIHKYDEHGKLVSTGQP